MSIAAGTKLGPYEIVAPIGAGGMGEVYRARDTRLSRDVAIKVLPAAFAQDADRLARFEREAKAVAGLSHPNILAIFDFGVVDGLAFAVMELLNGDTLRARLARGPMPVRKAIECAVQLTRGLAAAHDRGLIHRDIKPDNIFLLKDGQVKILDFGLARAGTLNPGLVSETPTRTAVALTDAGTVMGTVGYMSPEQVRGQTVDARSDLFALGILLYEMLTGQRAFQGATAADTLAAILNIDPPELSRSNNAIPPSLDRVVRHCLEKNPLERFQTARDIEFALGAAQVATPASGKRSWIQVALVAAAVVVAGAAMTMVVKTMRSAPAAVPAALAHARTAIAVLPFRNLSTGESNAYFASGLQDELQAQLTKVASLTVMGRTSVMPYAGTTKTPPEIARELSVGSLVDGTVQVIGTNLKVIIHLLDANTGHELWGNTYHGTTDNAFAIQSDVAQRVVAAVGAAVDGTERASIAAPPTANAEAYRMYLQAKAYSNYSTRSELELAQRLFERTLALDPKFALAHIGLANAHGGMFWFKYDPSPERASRQMAAASEALRLAPDLPEAHWAMGMAQYWGRRNYQGALDEMAIALRSLPNNPALVSQIGYVHRRLGHWADVDAAFKKARTLDPRNWRLFSDLGGETFMFTHRYAEAAQAFDIALALPPYIAEVEMHKAMLALRSRGDLDPLRKVLDGMVSDTDLGVYGSVIGQRTQLLLLERKPEDLLTQLATAKAAVFADQRSYLPAALYAGWAQQVAGHTAAARQDFLAALQQLDAVSPALVDERVHAARGFALAGLERNADAATEARWLQRSPVYRDDAMGGSIVAADRAMILANAGEPAAALDEIERLLSGPSFLSVYTLRLDPRWDPIREQPRFKALLVKFAHPEIVR